MTGNRDTAIDFHYLMGQFWKLLLTTMCILDYFIDPQTMVTETSPWPDHWFYMFSHGNIFHLAANILCLWLLRARLHMPEALVIGFLASYLPMLTDGAGVMGLSGALFAICGIQWGKLHRCGGMLRRCVPVLLVSAFVPHMCWAVHAYALALGFGYGWLIGYRNHDLRL